MLVGGSSGVVGVGRGGVTLLPGVGSSRSHTAAAGDIGEGAAAAAGGDQPQTSGLTPATTLRSSSSSSGNETGGSRRTFYSPFFAGTASNSVGGLLTSRTQPPSSVFVSNMVQPSQQRHALPLGGGMGGTVGLNGGAAGGSSSSSSMRMLLGGRGGDAEQQQQLVAASPAMLRGRDDAAAIIRRRQRGGGGVGGGNGRDEDEEEDEEDCEDESSCFGSSAEDFEIMVGDLRRTFISWLRKTEGDLRKEKRDLHRAKQEFEEEKRKAWQQLQEAKQSNHEKIKEERRKAQAEAASQMKQIQTEREDSRRKLNAERLRFEEEKELHRRKSLLETERLRQEADALEAEKRRIVDTNIATETVVDLNVGGVIFEAARHTLQQQQGSFLHALLSGRHHVARDKNGRIFLDRDAELFRIVLNFLRNPSTPPQPRDACESDAITQEADYLGIRFFPFPLVFCVGGHNGVEHLPSLEVLDVAQQCWRPCKSMQTERAYFACSNFQNKLFVYGGQNLDYKALCDTEVFDCLRDCWVGGATLNVPRRNTCGAYVRDRHFAVGGFDGENILAAVEAYDPRMKNWMQLAPLNTPRSSAMACVHEETLYVLGGTSGERLRTVERYDPRMNKWEDFPSDMIEVRSAGAAACNLCHILVIGGIDSGNNILNSVEVLDPQSKRWSFIANMPDARMDCAAVTVAGSILVAGGQSEEVLSSTAFLRQELLEWHAGPPLLTPRYGHGLLVANL